MEDRIVNLEEKFAHLERYVEELDGVVREAHERLSALGGEMTRLRAETRQQFAELASDDENGEPPSAGGESA
ncbi:MAG: SlyX family protein [Planctomycetota bacterium]|nr:SlyX family protein [Planctomycetota bacterium]